MKTPKLCKNGGSAFVTWRGKRFHLGKYGTPEAEQAYKQWLDDWLLDGYSYSSNKEITVSNLCTYYLQYAQKKYISNGKPTSTIHMINSVIRRLSENYGSLPAKQFGPLKLRTLRNVLLTGTYTSPPKPLKLETVEIMSFYVKSIFKYAASMELIDIHIYQSLETVESLRGNNFQTKIAPQAPPA